jgi:hypothetical protein
MTPTNHHIHDAHKVICHINLKKIRRYWEFSAILAYLAVEDIGNFWQIRRYCPPYLFKECNFEQTSLKYATCSLFNWKLQMMIMCSCMIKFAELQFLIRPSSGTRNFVHCQEIYLASECLHFVDTNFNQSSITTVLICSELIWFVYSDQKYKYFGPRCILTDTDIGSWWKTFHWIDIFFPIYHQSDDS